MTDEKIFWQLKYDYNKNIDLEIVALKSMSLETYISVEEYPRMNALHNKVLESSKKLAEFAKIELDKRAAYILNQQLRKKPPFA